MKLLSAFILVSFSLNAFAATTEELSAKLSAALESKQYQSTEVEISKLSAKENTALLEAATDESGIWGDTILEGDYILDSQSKIELLSVEKLVSNTSEFLGYRIMYQHGAYETGSCEVDWDAADENPEAFEEQLNNDCTRGHIIAGAYVTPDFKDHFRDEDAIEDFSD
jgi:hypothetical protein